MLFLCACAAVGNAVEPCKVCSLSAVLMAVLRREGWRHHSDWLLRF